MTEPTNSAPNCCATASASADGSSPDPRIAQHFDRRVAELSEGGEFPDLVDVSRGLLFLLSDVGSERPTLLELGCGSGAMSVTLLEAGALSVDGVDLSPESIATATRRAESAGLGERAHFSVGDGSVVPLQRHDWVVMDRVMCCFADMERLLGNAITAADERICFTVPQSRGAWGIFNRMGWGFEAWLTRFRRGACPGYVHSLDLMAERLHAAGFELLRERPMGVWYAAVWQRA